MKLSRKLCCIDQRSSKVKFAGEAAVDASTAGRHAAIIKGEYIFARLDKVLRKESRSESGADALDPGPGFINRLHHIICPVFSRQTVISPHPETLAASKCGGSLGMRCFTP